MVECVDDERLTPSKKRHKLLVDDNELQGRRW